MTTYFSMYGPPVDSVAGLRLKPPNGIFESDHSDFDGDQRFILCEPPYTVNRDKALFFSGLREDIISGLRQGNAATITIEDGTIHIKAKKGSSGATKAARTAVGAVKGSVATALTAVLSTPEGIQKSVRNLFAKSPKANPLTLLSPSSQRKKHIGLQHANLELAVVQVSSGASNVHNAFKASSRSVAGENDDDADSANSLVSMYDLAGRLQRKFGF